MTFMHLVPLPIDSTLPAALRALQNTNSLLLVAPPGAGKTTRVPPALLDAGFADEGHILLIEPRRLAARAAARRMARERNQDVGHDIGYQVRFDRRVGSRTKIIAVTPGILLRWMQEDAYLSSASVVLFDEFHERGVECDLALGMLKLVQESVRPDLKLILMSATLAAESLSLYLDGCPVIDCPGRMHPVKIEYHPRPVMQSIAENVAWGVELVLSRTDGDILAFLPGMREIRDTARRLESLSSDLAILPLHGDLPLEEQDAALGPSSRRKVVLATNVAESSITVEGITAVVDSGMARSLSFDAGLGMDRLDLKPISRASAEQRAGRAGRTQPGICIRLWSEAWHRNLEEHIEPEIRRVDLAGPLLHLLALGETDVEHFPWLDAPPPENVERALKLLVQLGALDTSRKLTNLGKSMARLPVHPRLARFLLEARRMGCADRAALAGALLSDRDVFPRRDARGQSRRSSIASDVLERVEALEQMRACGFKEDGTIDPGSARYVVQTAKQLLRLLDDEAKDNPGLRDAIDSDEALARSLLAAYPDRIVKRRGPGQRRGVMLGGRGVVLAPSSGVLDGELFLAIDLDAGAEESLVRIASGIQRDWLPRDRLQWHTAVFFNEDEERVQARKRLLIDNDLVLEDNHATLPKSEEVARVLVESARGRLARVLPEKESTAGRFLARVRFLARWMPELNLSAFDDAELADLLPWVANGCKSFAEVRSGNWLGMMQGKMTSAQTRTLEQEAPERILVPSGSAINLQYEEDRPPVLAVRIQELFGMPDTPRLAGGRVRVLLHLLAPNYRPQQITDDLASFWKNTYPVVRKELRARYPKHPWPEDPLEACAVRK